MENFNPFTFDGRIGRLQYFDKSGWWYLLSFILFANFVLGLILLLAPGSQGANTYGVRVR